MGWHGVLGVLDGLSTEGVGYLGDLWAYLVAYYAVVPVLTRLSKGNQWVLGGALAGYCDGIHVVLAAHSPGPRRRVRFSVLCVIGRSPKTRVAAGVTFTIRTTFPQQWGTTMWDARFFHTSVIDAAGAIYVIGGGNGLGPQYPDVWVSTDGGADRSWWCSRGTRGVLGGTRWATTRFI